MIALRARMVASAYARPREVSNRSPSLTVMKPSRSQPPRWARDRQARAPDRRPSGRDRRVLPPPQVSRADRRARRAANLATRGSPQAARVEFQAPLLSVSIGRQRPHILFLQGSEKRYLYVVSFSSYSPSRRSSHQSLEIFQAG